MCERTVCRKVLGVGSAENGVRSRSRIRLKSELVLVRPPSVHFADLYNTDGLLLKLQVGNRVSSDESPKSFSVAPQACDAIRGRILIPTLCLFAANLDSDSTSLSGLHQYERPAGFELPVRLASLPYDWIPSRLLVYCYVFVAIQVTTRMILQGNKSLLVVSVTR